MSKRMGLLSSGLLAAAILLAGFATAIQFGHAAKRLADTDPATPAMMQVLSEEHGLVADMIKTQLAMERDEHARQETASGPSPMATAPPQRDRASFATHSHRKTKRLENARSSV
jgi:hypothetical protein